MSVVLTKRVIILIELVSFGGALKNILLIFLSLALRGNLYLDSRKLIQRSQTWLVSVGKEDQAR